MSSSPPSASFFFVGVPALHASPPSFEAIRGSDRYRVAIPDRTPAEIPADIPTSVDGIRISPVRPELLKKLPPAILHAGDGGGASISSISLTQVG